MKQTLHPAGTWDAEKFKKWRMERGFTQIQAADALGVTLRAIETWERGARRPAFPDAIHKLMKMAKPRRRSA